MTDAETPLQDFAARSSRVTKRPGLDVRTLTDRGIAPPLTTRFSARPGLLVALVATLLALVVTMPVAIHPTSNVYGPPGDGSGTVTFYWWWSYALTHGKSIFDNQLQGVPLGSEWSRVPLVPLSMFIFAPLSVLLGPVLSYNVLILSSFPLTAWATYMLGRRLGLTALPAAFSGLTFAFTPYHLEKAMGHGNQAHLELLVGELLLLVTWRARGRIRYIVGAGILAGLQLWAETSIAYVLVFAVATFFLVSASIGLLTEPRKWEVLRRHLGAGALLAAISALFVPVAVVFLHRPGTPGSTPDLLALEHRDLGQVQIYSARLHEYVQPYYNNPLVPALIKRWELAHLHGSNWTESTILLGFTVIVLAIVGIILTRRLFPVALATALIAAGALLAMPPTRLLFGRPVHFPSYYLFGLISSYRVYARFSWMVLLGGSLLAGLGLAALQSRLRPGSVHVLLLIPFLLAAIEFNNLPPERFTQVFPAPAEYVWLRDQPQGVLLEYPANAGDLPRQEVQIRRYLLYQMVHLHPTFLTEVNGAAWAEAKRLEPYYAPGVVARLKALGVRYVFVHQSDYSADGFDLSRNVDGLSYVTTLDGVDIFTVD